MHQSSRPELPEVKHTHTKKNTQKTHKKHTHKTLFQKVKKYTLLRKNDRILFQFPRMQVGTERNQTRGHGASAVRMWCLQSKNSQAAQGSNRKCQQASNPSSNH